MNLPRLLYLADVPVESTMHGSALIYRLLQDYPPERLFILESNLYNTRADRRLPNVRYSSFRAGWGRLLYTRLSRAWASWLSLSAPWRANRAARSVKDFAAEAILTVTHNCSWITAAHLAAARHLPLHLILHDECVELPAYLDRWKPFLERTFSRVYRQAVSRLCVSPYMAENCLRRCGVSGSVLYPARAPGSPEYGGPPHHVGTHRSDDSLTVFFGGTVANRSTLHVLHLVGEVLHTLRGKLVIYSNLKPNAAATDGLNSDNILLKEPVPSANFIAEARANADVLFVPLSFDPSDRTFVQVNFPSKLADYTSAGLPLLVMGPETSSGVRWARENAPVAEVVTHDDAKDLGEALERLLVPQHRARLAAQAVEKGQRFFSPANAWNILVRHLQAPMFAQRIHSTF